MISERKIFEDAVDNLLAKDGGRDMWCWLRRRASALLEHELYAQTGSSEGWDEIGSSDVSCKLYDVWLDQYRSTGQARINDSIGFQINSRVQGYIW